MTRKDGDATALEKFVELESELERWAAKMCPARRNGHHAKLLTIMKNVFVQETSMSPGPWFSEMIKMMEANSTKAIQTDTKKLLVTAGCALLDFACRRPAGGHPSMSKKKLQTNFGNQIGTALTSLGIVKPQGGYYGWDDLRKKAEQLANKDDRHYALFKHSLEKGVLSSDELLYGLVLMGRAVLEDPKCKFETMFRGHE